MRSFLAGLFLLLASAGGAFGQATGYVTALGFQGNYRPDCWTPLLVHLDSTVSDPAEYQIQVHQQDLDKDTVVYARTVTLGPQGQGPEGHQNYWVYFLPQPTGRKADGGSLPPRGPELADALQVHLYDKAGRTEIARLPVQLQIDNIDPGGDNFFSRARGTRLILAVVERDLPAWSEYGRAVGLVENVRFVPVKAADLPESVLGYQAVDGIVWFDAKAADISTGGSKAFDALQQYVRGGGQLVVCQPAEFYRIAPFANAGMLPIVADNEGAVPIATKSDLEPLTTLALPNTPLAASRAWTAVQKSKPAWSFARARPLPSAKVAAVDDEWVVWNGKAWDDPAADKSPYIVRGAYGMGSVTWVAQDLGDPALTVAGTTGWPHVWDRIFGWKNLSFVDAEQTEAVKLQYGDATMVDLGGSLRKLMEHAATAAAYIFIAVLFFIGYWVLAGPGSYLFLVAKRKQGMSWVAFGAVAVAAAGLTVAVVKLVLRGRPTAHHVSVVRLVPTDPSADGTPQFSALIHSRFGLYVPRDGDQSVTLNDTAAGRVSYLTPFAVHPSQVSEEAGFTDRARYVVSTDNLDAGKPITVDVPYRSTLKKLQAQWAGTTPAGITGAAALLAESDVKDPKDATKTVHLPVRIGGRLTNKTGRALTGVYVAFSASAFDDLLYLASWPKDATIDLEKEFLDALLINPESTPGDLDGVVSVRGVIRQSSWGRFWYKRLGTSMAQGDAGFDDHERNYDRSLPMMAFFGRLEPQRTENNQRAELLRRGGRELDVSPLVAAGRLVIVARAADVSPLPLPLTVDGDKVEGEGVTFYEVALPLDRTALDRPPPPNPAAATQATRPAGGK